MGRPGQGMARIWACRTGRAQCRRWCANCPRRALVKGERGCLRENMAKADMSASVMKSRCRPDGDLAGWQSRVGPSERAHRRRDAYARAAPRWTCGKPRHENSQIVPVRGIFASKFTKSQAANPVITGLGGSAGIADSVSTASQERGSVWVEVEGGRVPTSDWMLNLQILTSSGYRYVPESPHH